MKELSIEEKAKAYDEALERAKSKIKNDKDHVLYEDDIIDIFPALKESEDEKIRKEMIEILEKEARDFPSSVIAEKSNSWIAWLEKQGEQKPVFEMKTAEESLGIDSDTYNKIVDECIYGEQKTADKVEPKFKIEEEKWYVCTQTYVLRGKIVVIKGQTYQSEKDNVIKGENGYLFIDRHDGKALDYFRSWTIQDAKDGDVLYSTGWHNDCIFIFKGLDNWKFDEPNGDRVVATGYCCLFVSADNMEFGIQGPDCVEVNTVKPATKIQCNLLFQKMKEAGYEWDAEHKQLYKQLKKEKVDNLHNYLYGEQKPAWSKEDEYVIETIFCLLHNEQDKYPQQSSEFQELEEIENKLKSLKDRVQPQPKQEWSEEDEQYLLVCKNALAKYQTTDKWDAHIIFHWLENKLKSLRPRNTWKPSEEEMVALEHAINCYSSISPTNTNEVFTLEIMKERLKNLMK